MRRADEYESLGVRVAPDTRVCDVADEMEAHGVGSVLVVDAEDAPIGIVTDRDLVKRVVADDRDPTKTTAEEVMSRELLLGRRDQTTQELLTAMAERGVRRVALVEDGRLVGVLTLDDLVVDLGVQLWNLAETVRAELREEDHQVRTRRRQESRNDALEDIRRQVLDLGGQIRDRVETDLRDLVDRLTRSGG